MQIKDTYIELSQTEIQQVHIYLANIIGFELTALTTPCYAQKLTRYEKDFMAKCKITPQKVKMFKKQLDPKYAKFSMFNNSFTVALIMMTIYFSRIKDYENAKFAYLLLSIKFYGSLVLISFPRFCNKDLWELTLSNISPKHLFREKNGISNTIFYLSEIVYKKFQSKLSTPSTTDFDIVRLTFEIRGRLSQSIKSLAEKYYSIQKSGQKIASEYDENLSIEDNLNTIADKISTSICTFEQIDDKCLELAILKSGLRREIAESLIDELSSVNYREIMRFIIILICRVSSIKSICRENTRLALIRKIDSGSKIDKYIVKKEILQMMYETELGFRLKTMNKSQLVIFFVHYITKFIQIKIC